MLPSNKRHLREGVAFIKNIPVKVTVARNSWKLIPAQKFSWGKPGNQCCKISFFKVMFYIDVA